MDLSNAFIRAQFRPKGLYYFSSEHLSSEEPHYFLIVEIDGRLAHLVVCTSQFEKRVKYLEMTGGSTETLVWIKPTGDNALKKDSFVDCNNVFSDYTIEKLIELFESKKLKLSGHIDDSEYYQILNGITKSDSVDLRIVEMVAAILKNL